MTDEEFDVVRRILEKAAGLVHDDTRRESLSFSVLSRVDATRSPSVAAYLALVGGSHGALERQLLIDEVTIQETHFFRNPPQIRALRQHVLPEIIRRAAALDRPVNIWSAGCSTGEEPYSVAMLVREIMPMASREHVRILGTDVSANALRIAEQARYGARAVQMAEPVDLARWFTASGDNYVVREDVRDLVELRLHNLVTEAPPFEPGEVDLVLCRNVTIYFNRATTKQLMGRFHTALRKSGYLFLGHSETLWQMSDAFTLVPLGDAFVYRKDDQQERRAVLPERRTEEGDAPVLLNERRHRSDRRRRGGEEARPGRVVKLPVGEALSSPRPRPKTPSATARATEFVVSARQSLAAGRYADAVVAAGRAARADLLLVDPHVIAGEALVNLGRDADAVKELRQAVYLQPDCGPAHLLLAGALDRLGEPAAAGRAYRAAATTIGELPHDQVAAFFGGRDASELVELCIRLAMQAERAARTKGMIHGAHKGLRGREKQ